MQRLETLLREAGVAARPRARAESVVGELGPEALREVIDSLPERQRLVLALRYYEALDLPEIAAVLGAKEEQSRELLARAAQALCDKLERMAVRRPRRRAGAHEGIAR